MKIKYNNILIGGFNDLDEQIIVTLDKSLLVHNEEGEQVWLLMKKKPNIEN